MSSQINKHVLLNNDMQVRDSFPDANGSTDVENLFTRPANKALSSMNCNFLEERQPSFGNLINREKNNSSIMHVSSVTPATRNTSMFANPNTTRTSALPILNTQKMAS